MGKQALDGKRLNAFAMDPEDLVIVGIDTPHKKGEHPLWDERIHLPLDQNMVLNIMAEGVHEPILVRKNGDAVEVVNGRQRVRHARVANERLATSGKEALTVKAIVERGSDERMFGIMISTNEIRRADELEAKLSKLERYLAMGRTEDDAAIAFGVTAQTIRNWLAILEASPEVRAAVKTGDVSATAAAKLSKLPRDQQAAAIKEAKAEGGPKLTVEKASRKAKKAASAGVKGAVIVLDKPTGKLVKRLLEANATSDLELGGDESYEKGFFDAIKWMRGELSEDRIKNLKRAIREAMPDEVI